MTTDPELVALRTERMRLSNKLERGLFTSENDARGAQDRLNYVNVLIDNAIQESRNEKHFR